MNMGSIEGSYGKGLQDVVSCSSESLRIAPFHPIRPHNNSVNVNYFLKHPSFYSLVKCSLAREQGNKGWWSTKIHATPGYTKKPSRYPITTSSGSRNPLEPGVNALRVEVEREVKQKPVLTATSEVRGCGWSCKVIFFQNPWSFIFFVLQV